MILTSLSLQHFRSYSKTTFSFSPQTTIIVGPNTAGKSNLLEAVFLLASGKSARADKDTQMIESGKGFARVVGDVDDNGAKEVLEVIVAQTQQAGRSFSKRFLLNGVPKRRVDFAGVLPALLFVPSDLDIITSSPSHRRNFLDEVLEVTDKQYRLSSVAFEKALRQRNALLDLVKETGIRNERQFAYWDELMIEHGSYITAKREELLNYCNTEKKELADFRVVYDKSTISEERLTQYKEAEAGAGVTLVGPHRDDFRIELPDGKDVRHFGSRGQQRLVVLQLKLLQLSYMEQVLNSRPLLLLDDIFSELDAGHIHAVLGVMNKQQTILTTTHKEFVSQGETDGKIIELTKETALF